jgi:hypothetical protein
MTQVEYDRELKKFELITRTTEKLSDHALEMRERRVVFTLQSQSGLLYLI